MQCCSQLIFLRGWWLKDQSILMRLKTTSNKTEVRKGGGCPPFQPLATTLFMFTHGTPPIAGCLLSSSQQMYGVHVCTNNLLMHKINS